VTTRIAVQITQRELEEIFELERELQEKEKHLDELKQNVKVLMFAKAPVEQGRFVPHLVKIPGRNVPWKQLFVEELGVVFMESCRKRYPVKMRFDLKVEEHAVLPLWKDIANSSAPPMS
jgi:hypothetical protein